ncbi:PREDICTED: uncharacterized protein LOC108544163 isoform X2 [Rhinopithecus bieti]|uniref:uncharacterized protein LOC108544163 isoform X2 n=1 Tax=Rhinopithecus bieti TaxID=61621 RepID=UPI00083C4BC5|nr:PREDICTED: uncharacterized protein LOC108544163 isoform X2 [Rhinopithecus bieti]
MWCECQILYEKCQTEQGAPGMSASASPQLLKPSAPQAKIHLFNKHRRGPEPQGHAPLGNPDISPGHLTESQRPLSPPAPLPHAFPSGVAPPPAAAQAGSSPPGHLLQSGTCLVPVQLGLCSASTRPRGWLLPLLSARPQHWCEILLHPDGQLLALPETLSLTIQQRVSCPASHSATFEAPGTLTGTWPSHSPWCPQYPAQAGKGQIQVPFHTCWTHRWMNEPILHGALPEMTYVGEPHVVRNLLGADQPPSSRHHVGTGPLFPPAPGPASASHLIPARVTDIIVSGSEFLLKSLPHSCYSTSRLW